MWKAQGKMQLKQLRVTTTRLQHYGNLEIYPETLSPKSEITYNGLR